MGGSKAFKGQLRPGTSQPRRGSSFNSGENVGLLAGLGPGSKSRPVTPSLSPLRVEGPGVAGASARHRRGASADARFSMHDELIDAHGDGHKSGTAHVLVNILISFVGAGILGLPYAFRRAGMVQGTVVMSLTGVAAYVNMLKLMAARRRAGSREVVTYSELAGHFVGAWARWTVDVLLVTSQMGFCVAYMLFLGKNLSKILKRPDWGFILAAAPAEMALAMVRSLSGLAPVSLVADAANLLGYVFVYAQDVGSWGTAAGIVGWNPASFTFILGASAYCFEGMAMVLPLEHSARDQAAFPAHLALGMVIVTLLNVTFAAAGYYAFGDQTQDIVTLNLEGQAGTLVKLCLCLGLLLTFPIMMVPCYEIFERRMAAAPLLRAASPAARDGAFRAVRGLLVAAIVLVSLFVPSFGLLMELIGSVACSTLMLVMPPLIEMRSVGKGLGWGDWGMDCLYVALGLFLSVSGVADAAAHLRGDLEGGGAGHAGRSLLRSLVEGG